MRQLAALQESDEANDDNDEEGTAKMGNKMSPTRQNSQKTVEQRGLVTQGRLSSLFEGWLGSTPPTSPTRNSAIFTPENRKSVSEPRLLQRDTISLEQSLSDAMGNEDDAQIFEAEFEEMMVSETPLDSYRSILLKLWNTCYVESNWSEGRETG